MKLWIADYVFVQQTTQKGFGVFTYDDIAAEEIIEISPVIVLPKKDKVLLDKTGLYFYIFDWGDDTQECAMAMGYVPVYNHSYESNCEYFMDFDDKTIFIKTVRAVKKGEELTINYNGTSGDMKPIWFDVK
jgi:uncharacterized protein